MKSKIASLVLTFLLLVSTVLLSCTQQTSTTSTTSTTTPAATSKSGTTSSVVTTSTVLTATSTVVTTSTTTPLTNKPQYGGKINVRVPSVQLLTDSYYGLPTSSEMGQIASCVQENSFAANLSVDRSKWDFKTKYIPLEYRTGLLAESWETKDFQTITLHIRQGVHWQNKAPVNGREFTADDIVYTLNRLWGIGSGFTKPAGTMMGSRLLSATAADKYTVVLKYDKPSIMSLVYITDPAENMLKIVPHEWADKGKDYTYDWKNFVGTGPFILTDYLAGSSLTMVKNSDYWGFDDRYPENRLPYADQVNVINIADPATSIAALRTGKIDWLDGLNVDQAESLNKTNPELKQVTRPDLGYNLNMRLDLKPFNDIRVRQALQKSIDLAAIAKGYYKGAVIGEPTGLFSPSITSLYTPFNKWPEEVQKGYTYNLREARQLMTDAGYPNGFMTDCVTRSDYDTVLLQVIKSYFAEIGVTLNISAMDTATYLSFVVGRKQTGMIFNDRGTAFPWPPANILTNFVTGSGINISTVSDPIIDDLNNKANNTVDQNLQTSYFKQLDAYINKMQYRIQILPRVVYCVYQPWFKEYAGEPVPCGVHFKRFWIDQTVQK